MTEVAEIRKEDVLNQIRRFRSRYGGRRVKSQPEICGKKTAFGRAALMNSLHEEENSV